MTTRTTKDAPTGRTSAQALVEVARRTGVPLSPRDFDNLARKLPVDELPPVVRGRRLWSPVHIEAVVRMVAGVASP